MIDQEAVGVHDHPVLKLGIRPADPEAKFLNIGDFLTGVVPQHPEQADYLNGIQFGLYKNDTFGVCGPTSVANSRREITARLKGAMQAPSLNDVFDLYRRSGNPNFDPNTGADDNGVNMKTMLDAVQKGGIGGVKCLGFAKVPLNDLEQLQACIAIFGFLLLAVDLQKAQQSQTNQGVWDYSPSGPWGGHAIMGGAYVSNPDDLQVITWAQRVKMTKAFMNRQLSEAWVVIWPEHLTDSGFLNGVDLRAFASAWEAITGKKFPAELPPPSPTPTPSPAQGGINIDLAAKKITYPSGWTATQIGTGLTKDDFSLI